MEGQYDEWYDYTVMAIDPEGQNIRYWIDWGDGHIDRWEGPYGSGIERIFSYKWDDEGTYTIAVMAEDDRGAYSDWGYLEVTMPVNQQVINPLLQRFLERFPNAFPILRHILRL
jgi:hypothetical protein